VSVILVSVNVVSVIVVSVIVVSVIVVSVIVVSVILLRHTAVLLQAVQSLASIGLHWPAAAVLPQLP